MPVIIETGGKQYCVEPGEKIAVERMTAQVNETVHFKNLLDGTMLTATVIEHLLAPKVVTRKFRNKTRYHRLKGHRQPLTVLQFTETGKTQKSVTPTPKIRQARSKQKES